MPASSASSSASLTPDMVQHISQPKPNLCKQLGILTLRHPIMTSFFFFPYTHKNLKKYDETLQVHTADGGSI